MWKVSSDQGISSNISLFDRDWLNGFSQVLLRLWSLPYVGYEYDRSSHKACCPVPFNS